MKPLRLNERFIDGLAYNGKAYSVRDTKTVGFFVQVNARSKSYKVQHDLWRDGRKVKTVRHTLGRTDQMSLAQARTAAMEVLAQVRRGVDPNGTQRPKKGLWTVEQMFAEHQEALRIGGGAERTIEDVGRLAQRYFGDWQELPIDTITKAMARARHASLSQDNGKVAANKALQAFGSAYRFADKTLDEPLPPNPVQGVTFNRVRSTQRVIMLDALSEWWEGIQALPNPLRRCMHELGLFSGLRPGNLVALRREWIDLEKQVISIPATHMKRREPFDLPLSGHMVPVRRGCFLRANATAALATFRFGRNAAYRKPATACATRSQRLRSTLGWIRPTPGSSCTTSFPASRASTFTNAHCSVACS